jgi:NitT/TauT family transport system substrate-binding protein
MNKRIFVICTLLLLLLLGACGGRNSGLSEVKVASGGHITHFLPFDLANQLGYFEEEGLKLNVIYVQGGTATAQALLSGQADFSTNSIDHAFKSAVQGKDNLRMVVLMNQTPGMVLLAGSKNEGRIKSVSDLKGMRLGVTSKGSATHMVLAYLLSRNGVNPDSVSIFNAGSATFSSALNSDEIQAGIALEPFASKMIEDGDAFVLQSLISMGDTKIAFDGPYNQAGILTTQAYIDQNEETVHKFVNAIVRALHFIQEHTPEEIVQVLPSTITGTDREQYILTLKLLKDFYSPDGFINPKGVENVYQSIISSGELKKDQKIDFNKYFTNGFIKKK